MKKDIFIIYVLLLYLDNLEGANHQIEDDQCDYRLPSKTILSNIIRAQTSPTHLQKKQRENLRNSLESNILTQFLNRFQPALDRETKKVAEKLPPSDNESSADKIKSEYMSSPYYYRDVRSALSKENKKLTTCTRVPGKVMCEFGPYTYVIKTKNKDLDNTELEKVVGMIHQRIQEGDKSFDLSVSLPVDKQTAASEMAPDPFALSLPDDGSQAYNSPPIMVECTPIEHTRNKLSADKEEIKYSCNWHPIKLRKRNAQALTTERILSAVVAKTCSTPLFVRKFTDICTTRPGWCPHATITPCKTSQIPVCIPWCNPFLKGAKYARHKLKSISIV